LINFPLAVALATQDPYSIPGWRGHGIGKTKSPSSGIGMDRTINILTNSVAFKTVQNLAENAHFAWDSCILALFCVVWGDGFL